MRNIQFQKAKLKRLIDVQGRSYTFYRDGKNELGEPNNSVQMVTTLTGIWHESQGYVNVTSGDASTVKSKPQSQILTLWDYIGDISQGDYIRVGKSRYNVTEVHDPTNLGVAADISLEVVV